MAHVLFVCPHNAGRSQMAARFATALSNGRVTATSAGLSPAARINPVVVSAMTELGLDLTGEFPKPVEDDHLRAADVVVTLGCDVTVPAGTHRLGWDVPDTSGQSLDNVRGIRDDLRARVIALLVDLDVSLVG